MNDDTLRALALQYRGSVLEALVQLSCIGSDDPHTAASLARALGMSRQVLEQATHVYQGRTYAHILRSIESQMGLSQYLLDELLPEGDDGI